MYINLIYNYYTKHSLVDESTVLEDRRNWSFKAVADSLKSRTND